MIKHNFYNFLRKVIPRKIITLIKFYKIFNNIYGHSNIKDNFIYNGYGHIFPWITYPCIEFLNRLKLDDCTVFEFGAGSSTMYWSKKAKKVRSIEKDKNWFDAIKNKIPKNCEVTLAQSDEQYIGHIQKFDENFDIIVIDGAVRYPCAQAALKKISERGLIILDNTEWYPETARMLNNNGFTQIDFSGFPPINAFPSCTSIFYKKTDLLDKRLNKAGWAPLGGRFIKAYDDKSFDLIDPQYILKER